MDCVVIATSDRKIQQASHVKFWKLNQCLHCKYCSVQSVIASRLGICSEPVSCWWLLSIDLTRYPQVGYMLYPRTFTFWSVYSLTMVMVIVKTNHRDSLFCARQFTVNHRGSLSGTVINRLLYNRISSILKGNRINTLMIIHQLLEPK